MKYCKEYAVARGWNHWHCNLEDAFINLRVNRTCQEFKECVFYCDGLEITRIKIDVKGNRFVKMEGYWQPYPTAVKAETQRIETSARSLNNTIQNNNI